MQNVDSCCCAAPKTRLEEWLSNEKAYKIINMICRVAIAAFALYVAPIPFLISFGVGVVLGAAWAIYKDFNTGGSEGLAPVCAQGYAKMLADVNFPPIVNLVITAAFIGAHLHCESVFFVPFAGVFVGFYAGKEALEIGNALYKRVVHRSAKLVGSEVML